MRSVIIKNCWELIETWNCQYGAHIFDGKNVKIYVHNWLDVDQSIKEFFIRKNSDGFVGHCLLVFINVKRFDFNIFLKENNIFLDEPIYFSYKRNLDGNLNLFEFEGSLYGFDSSVSISIEAQDFELQILQERA